jgi:hypothetical protein
MLTRLQQFLELSPFQSSGNEPTDCEKHQVECAQPPPPPFKLLMSLSLLVQTWNTWTYVTIVTSMGI